MNFKEFKDINSKAHSFCLSCGEETIKSVIKGGREFYRCTNCRKDFERAIIIRPNDLYDFKSDGTMCHFSVGTIIKRKEKYLLFRRRKFPFVWVSPAGHLDKGENPKEAAIREVGEETGLTVKNIKLLFEEELLNDPCRRGVNVHHWRLYICQCTGKLKPSEEAELKTIGWYKPKEIGKFELSNPTEHFFKKLKII